jgi:hypothetical protein
VVLRAAATTEVDSVGEVFDRWADDVVRSMDDPAQYHAVIARLPEDAVQLIAANTLYGEVLNGWFHQYFVNSFGIQVDEAIRGLEKIGLVQYSAFAMQAKAIFGDSFPEDRMGRLALAGYREGDGLSFKEPTDRFIDLYWTRVDEDERLFQSYAASVVERHPT